MHVLVLPVHSPLEPHLHDAEGPALESPLQAALLDCLQFLGTLGAMLGGAAVRKKARPW